MKIRLIFPILSVGLIIFSHSSQAQEVAGFSAVWKLMAPADREHFVAGYLRGWKDASSFLDIAVEYVKTNPTQAPDALSKLRNLANLGEQKPAPLVLFIDQYYKDAANQSAPLSKAVSAARGAGVLYAE